MICISGRECARNTKYEMDTPRSILPIKNKNKNKKLVDPSRTNLPGQFPGRAEKT
jgi:hypothetical protein